LLKRGRSDDTVEVVQNRFTVYQVETVPLLDFYRNQGILRSIDGDGTREEVTKRIQKIIDDYAS